jgi:CMP/dCMP kinase
MAHIFQGKEQKNTQQVSTQLLPETLLTQEPMPAGIPPEDAVVVTIARQFGSGGSEVAQHLASLADLHYVDHHIITEVAQRLGIQEQEAARRDEQTTSTVRHVLNAIHASNPFSINYAYTNLVQQGSSLPHSRELIYLHLTQRVVFELATQGNVVIVGRGSQFLLRHNPRTLHVSIFASLPDRIASVMKQYQLQQRAALQLIEQKDYEQDSYLRHHYSNDGHHSGLYHLLINTSLFSYEQAARMIQQALPIVKDLSFNKASPPTKMTKNSDYKE